MPLSGHRDKVPVPLVDLRAIAGRDDVDFEPDVTILHVVAHIDGARTIQEVIAKSDVPEEHVQLCMRHLLHFGLIALIDAITLESRYWLTPEFHFAFDRPEVVTEVVRYVTAGSREGTPTRVQTVQGLYSVVDGWGQTLGEFQQAHAAELQEQGISLRHFITFGLLRGFLERLDSRNQALSEKETSELQLLRSTLIPRRKEELAVKLRSQGNVNADLVRSEVNRDPEIVKMVERLNELKAKATRSALNDGAGSDSDEPTRRP